MSKCIPVKLSDGNVVMANVDDDVAELDPQDVEALEQWVAMVKARHAKKKAKTQAGQRQDATANAT